MQFSGSVILQALADGLLLGAVFALVAVGLTFIWGVLKIVNFAHGEFLMLGLYVAFFLVTYAGFTPYLTILVTVPAVALIGAVIFRSTIRPILSDPPMNQIMLTLGISLILQNVALVAFRGDVRLMKSAWVDTTLSLGSVVVGAPQTVALVGAVLLTVGMWYFLRTTDVGRAVRAAAQNATAARLMGIDVKRIYLLSFALGAATVGLAASLILPFQGVSPTVGLYLGVMSFVVVVLGGMGNLVGCLVAGMLLGLCETVGAAVFPGTLSRGFTLAVFIAFLIFKPQGVLSRRQA